VERAGCQVAPGPAGVRAHYHQYAPACGAGRKESSSWPGSRLAPGPAAAVPAAVPGRPASQRCGGAAVPAQRRPAGLPPNRECRAGRKTPAPAPGA
jgi:hypothetical protein